MMKFITSILIVAMTFNASASEEEIMQALMSPIPTEAEANPEPQIPAPKLLAEGEPAPYEGLLLDAELFYYFSKRITKIDGCEAALIKQNDYLTDSQVKIIQLEFERDNARAKVKEYNMVSGIFWVFLGIIVGSAVAK
jgi:hypothetical protein